MFDSFFAICIISNNPWYKNGGQCENEHEL